MKFILVMNQDNLLHILVLYRSFSAHLFLLNNVLCVPSLQNNEVAFTSTPTYFQVRDLHTGTFRLERTPKKGTYVLPTLSKTKSSLTFAYVSKATMVDWHSRLGHPAYPILHKQVSKFLLLLDSSVAFNFSL